MRGAEPEPIPRRRWLTSPLDDDDLLSFILRRLPPRPSSLPRASLVCKRWRALVSSPHFLREFRAFHRAVLGLFHNADLGSPDRRFVAAPAAADPPDDDRATTAAAFRVPCGGRDHQEDWRFLDCRHGRALLLGPAAEGPRREALVWDPITGARRRTPLPLDAGVVCHGAVLCSRGCGPACGCRFSAFRIILVWWMRGTTTPHWRAAAAIYSSESGAWSHVITVETRVARTVPMRSARKPGALAGDALYWLLPENNILEFDTVRHNLAVISVPASVASPLDYWQCQLLLTKAKELGLAMLTQGSIELWKRDRADECGWSRYRSAELDGCLPGPFNWVGEQPSLLGFNEESNAIFVWAQCGVFVIELESLRSRKLWQGGRQFGIYPFADFIYTGDAAGTHADDDAMEDTAPLATIAMEGLAMWHYADPMGKVHGPFSMAQLQQWNDRGFFLEDFMVWTTDKTNEQAVLLTDAML